MVETGLLAESHDVHCTWSSVTHPGKICLSEGRQAAAYVSCSPHLHRLVARGAIARKMIYKGLLLIKK